MVRIILFSKYGVCMKFATVFVLVMVCANLNAETKESVSSDLDNAYAAIDMLEKDKYYKSGELYK